MRFSWTTWASVRSLMTTESTPRRARRRGGPGRLSGYSTPLVWKTAQRSEVVFLGGQKVQSFDLVTGKQLWESGLAGKGEEDDAEGEDAIAAVERLQIKE